MVENRFGNKIIYQLAPRTFTPQGTLRAAQKLLRHIKDTGFDVVYLIPVFCADDDTDKNFWSEGQRKKGAHNPKNPYRMKDYFNVDEEYGTNEDLKNFVEAAHSHGLSVLLDLVYYHCGPKAVFLEEHPDFVKRDENGEFVVGEWFFPRLNFDNPELREYLWRNMEYYIREFDVDGYRCDIGSFVPNDFWVEGIRRIRKIKPNALMLNEGVVVDLTVGESENGVFDANYNINWSYCMFDVMDGKADASALREQWTKNTERYHGLLGKCTRMIDNHDFAMDRPLRHEIAWGHAGVECALVINYTIDGVPFVFNGCEVASSCGACALSSRLSIGENAIEWSNLLLPEGKRRLDFMKELNDIHHKYTSISKGSLVFLENTRDDSIFAFERRSGNERLITIANVGSGKLSVEVYADALGMDVIISADAICVQQADKFIVTIGSKGYIVLVNQA